MIYTPVLEINDDKYNGKLDVSPVLAALCSGFDSDSAPPACDSPNSNGSKKGISGGVVAVIVILSILGTVAMLAIVYRYIAKVEFDFPSSRAVRDFFSMLGDVWSTFFLLIIMNLVALNCLQMYMDREIRAIMAEYVSLDSENPKSSDLPAHKLRAGNGFVTDGTIDDEDGDDDVDAFALRASTGNSSSGNGVRSNDANSKYSLDLE